MAAKQKYVTVQVGCEGDFYDIRTFTGKTFTDASQAAHNWRMTDESRAAVQATLAAHGLTGKFYSVVCARTDYEYVPPAPEADEDEAPAQPPYNQFMAELDAMLTKATKSEEYAYLGGYNDDPAYVSGYAGLEAALTQALEDLKALRNHRHEYDGNDYCMTCGWDGRA